MTINANPFTSEVYESHWLHHFNNDEDSQGFDFIKGIRFTKHRFLPFYINIGKYKTCGISYLLDENSNTIRLGNKALLIYDVPEYFGITPQRFDNIKTLCSKQYKGYAIDLNNHGNINDFLTKQFSRRRRKKIIKSLNDLESAFAVTYKMYFGQIQKFEYDNLFDRLYKNIEAQFADKKTINSHTPPHIKRWHKPLLFDMINSGKASIFVIEKEGSPIAVSINYHSENVFFAAIPSYDEAYRKYGIGNIQTLKKIEWAINNDYAFYDMSKGSYGYKENWTNLEYNHQYHIIINLKSPTSLLTGYTLYAYFELKQLARKLYHKIKGNKRAN